MPAGSDSELRMLVLKVDTNTDISVMEYLLVFSAATLKNLVVVIKRLSDFYSGEWLECFST